MISRILTAANDRYTRTSLGLDILPLKGATHLNIRLVYQQLAPIHLVEMYDWKNIAIAYERLQARLLWNDFKNLPEHTMLIIN